MVTHLYMMSMNRRHEKEYIQCDSEGVAGFDTVMNTSADSPMGSIGPGRSLILSVIVWVAR